MGSKDRPVIVNTRFAPSPTGLLHVGGARTALFNYLWAKRNCGRFLLRFEDTDRARSSAEFEGAMLRDLEWLGILPDGDAARQTDRAARYSEALAELCRLGFAYACFCPPEEGGVTRPRADKCRSMPEGERARRMASGEHFCLRFAAPQGDGDFIFRDRLRGDLSVKLSSIGDFVLARSDGSPTYLFAVVVDDHDFNVTHVIRGEEHLPNTPKQELVYRALGWETPEWVHIPMVLDSGRHKLSKRSGAISVASYREDGWPPEALVSYMATLSWAGAPDDAISGADALAAAFDIGSVSLDSPVHDQERMNHFGKMAMRCLSVESLLSEFRALFPEPPDGGADIDSDRAALIGELLPSCACKSELERSIGEAFLLRDPHEQGGSADEAWARDLRETLSSVAPEAWCSENLKNILRGFQKERGLKGKDLYHCLRMRLTGVGHGAPIALVMGCLGKGNTIGRLGSRVEEKGVTL